MSVSNVPNGERPQNGLPMTGYEGAPIRSSEDDDEQAERQRKEIAERIARQNPKSSNRPISKPETEGGYRRGRRDYGERFRYQSEQDKIRARETAQRAQGQVSSGMRNMGQNQGRFKRAFNRVTAPARQAAQKFTDTGKRVGEADERFRQRVGQTTGKVANRPLPIGFNPDAKYVNGYGEQKTGKRVPITPRELGHNFIDTLGKFGEKAVGGNKLLGRAERTYVDRKGHTHRVVTEQVESGATNPGQRNIRGLTRNQVTERTSDYVLDINGNPVGQPQLSVNATRNIRSNLPNFIQEGEIPFNSQGALPLPSRPPNFPPSSSFSPQIRDTPRSLRIASWSGMRNFVGQVPRPFNTGVVSDTPYLSSYAKTVRTSNENNRPYSAGLSPSVRAAVFGNQGIKTSQNQGGNIPQLSPMMRMALQGSQRKPSVSQNLPNIKQVKFRPVMVKKLKIKGIS